MFKPINVDDIKYFNVECTLTACTMFPCLRKFCSCGQQIGYYQAYIESEIGKFLEEDDRDLNRTVKLQDARVRFITENNITRNCCQRSIMTYPFYVYNDIHGKQSNIDITIEIKKTSSSKQKKSSSFMERKKSNIFVQRNIFSEELNSSSVGWCPIFEESYFDRNKYSEKLRLITIGREQLKSPEKIEKHDNQLDIKDDDEDDDDDDDDEEDEEETQIKEYDTDEDEKQIKKKRKNKKKEKNTDTYPGVLYFPVNKISRRKISDYYIKAGYPLPFENVISEFSEDLN